MACGAAVTALHTAPSAHPQCVEPVKSQLSFIQIAHQNSRSLCAGGGALGHQLAGGALEQTCAAGPLHGRNGIAADVLRIVIGENVGILAYRYVPPFVLRVAPQNRCQLLTGQQAVGVKPAVGAVDDAVLLGPGNGFGVPRGICHVGECAASGLGRALHPVENLHQHGAGHTVVRCKFRFGNAREQAKLHSLG